MAIRLVWTKPRLFPKVSAMRSSLLEAKFKCSSGKKLEPAVWKFVQRLKTLSASSSSPCSRRSLDLEGSRPSVEEEVA